MRVRRRWRRICGVSGRASRSWRGRWGAGVARAVGRVERGWRWCRRNPAVAGLLGAVAAALLLGAAVATWFAVAAEANATRAEANATRADKEAQEARQNAAAEAKA